MMSLENIFNRLWMDYTSQNPSVQNVHDLFVNNGEKVFNDHIAFRTFDDKRVDIDVISKLFLKNGYVERGFYTFKEKHLIAKHFEHNTDKTAPRVFISQLVTNDFSEYLQNTIKELIDNTSNEKLKS